MPKQLKIEPTAIDRDIAVLKKQEQANEVAKVCLTALAHLRANRSASAAEIGQASQCGRKFVLKLLHYVQQNDLAKLISRNTFRVLPLLPTVRQAELCRKVGKELRSGKDIAEWYEGWSGKTVSLSTVYGWCRTRDLSLREGKLEPGRSRPHQRPRTALSLTTMEIERLKARQVQERISAKIPPGQWEFPRWFHPVKRMEAVLRLAAGGQSISQIARDLYVTRKDIRTWVGYYKKGGIEALCRMNYGGRPRNK